MESVVTLAIFAIITVGVLGVFQATASVVKGSRAKAAVASLANNYMEIARNLPYSQVGTVTGNPTGVLPDSTNATTTTVLGQSYRIYYEVTYQDDPADGVAPIDLAAADYKQVKMTVESNLTHVKTAFTTNIVPKGLEGTSGAGAILVKVFNAQGQPVPLANVHIQRPVSGTPTLVLDRLTGTDGTWTEVGLATGTNAYRIVVTKAGYSSDQTYAASSTNPNPTKPDVTVQAGAVTTVAFSIDQPANLTVRTLDQFCAPINGVIVDLHGAKLIGTNPDVYKIQFSSTSGPSAYPNGQIALTSIEWDTYTPTLHPGQSYLVRGSSPVQQVDVLPGASQVFDLILDGSYTTPHNLLVIVKDSATQAPLSGAWVQLQKGGTAPPPWGTGSPTYSADGYTAGSVWTQSDWTDGPGALSWTSSSTGRYYQDDGNVDINSVPTGLRLKKISGKHQPSGWLESSVFDTGTASTSYTTIQWQPTSQTSSTSIAFQIATADSNTATTTWSYLGPDGTAGTYYTSPGTTMHASHNGQRFVRYKVYLETQDDKRTPVLTSVDVNYVSGCNTPGQVFFKDLSIGNNYYVGVSLAGYQTAILNNVDISGSQVLQVTLSP